MKRAKAKRRVGDHVRWKFETDDGDADALPLEDAASKMAQNYFAHAAIVVDDEEKREHLWSKGRWWESQARAAIERRVTAQQAQRRRSAGGKTTAEYLKDEAADRNETLLRAARSILKDEPRMKIDPLAQMLSERGHGGAEALRKKLGRLLGRPLRRRRNKS